MISSTDLLRIRHSTCEGCDEPADDTHLYMVRFERLGWTLTRYCPSCASYAKVNFNGETLGISPPLDKRTLHNCFCASCEDQPAWLVGITGLPWARHEPQATLCLPCYLSDAFPFECRATLHVNDRRVTDLPFDGDDLRVAERQLDEFLEQHGNGEAT